MCAEPPGQMTDEKLHAVAAQGKFGNKQIKNSSHPEPFWELKLLKTCTALYCIRPCGAKQFGIQKYVTQTVSFGALLETELLKKIRHCGAKRMSMSKLSKTFGFGAFLEVEIEMVEKCTPWWR